ncbi:MAG TPA: DUF2059 domain-containing protein [Anaeromyxobacter sp.]
MRLAVVVAAALALGSSPAAAQAPGAQPSPPGDDRGTPPAAPPSQAAPQGPPAQNPSTPAEQAPKSPPAPRAAKKPPPAAVELARALLTAEQWAKILDSYASSLSGQVSQSLLASGEKVPDDLRGKIRAELEKSIPYRQTVDAQAEALSKQLTPDELKKTAAFYRSPLGKKVLERLPEAQSVVARQLQARLATTVPEIVSRLAPKALQGSPHGGGAPGSSPPAAQGRRPPPAPGAGQTQ